jgi:hypothetical protein
VKNFIDYLQSLIDLHGDSWLGMFTTLIMIRIGMVAFHYPPLTMAEAAAYSSCVAAFAASNIGNPKS